MNAPLALRPGEAVLFEGDVTILNSKLSVTETLAVVTDQRLYLMEGRRELPKARVESVEELQHVLTKKIVLKLDTGNQLAVVAANHKGFKAAVWAMVGLTDAADVPKEPDLRSVGMGTAWLAALGPFISGLVTVTVALLLWGSPEAVTLRQMIILIALRIAVIFALLQVDHLHVQRQGFNVYRLGLARPVTFPYYLFIRAKVFGHSKAPAIVWTTLVALSILAMVTG